MTYAHAARVLWFSSFFRSGWLSFDARRTLALNEPIVSAKAMPTSRPLYLDRNVFASMELGSLRENLVGGSVYRRKAKNTRLIVNNFHFRNLIATGKAVVL